MEFAPKQPQQVKKEILTTQHLEAGFKPITICTADQDTHFDNRMNIESTEDIYLADLIENSEDINFKNPALENNILTQGPYTYVISEVSESSKKSLGYINCTGIVATGVDRITKNNISFISHQEPSRIRDLFKEEFKQDLSSRLLELQEKSIPGSLDVVIAGGNAIQEKEETKENYEQMILSVAGIVKENIGINPVITSGPKNKIGQDSVIYDTEKRNLYVSRTAGLEMNQSAHHPN